MLLPGKGKCDRACNPPEKGKATRVGTADEGSTTPHTGLQAAQIAAASESAACPLPSSCSHGLTFQVGVPWLRAGRRLTAWLAASADRKRLTT